MIGYHILCHDNLEQVARLVESLWTPDATFLVDLDDGRKPDTRQLSRIAARSNVHLHTDGDIGWGGAGTLRKTLSGAFRLLDLSASWRYYIVLSGQDLPLKSNQAIHERLSRGDEHGTSYIRCNRAEPVALQTLPVANETSSCRLWGDRGHTRVYTLPGAIDAQQAMYARTLVDVTEVGRKGEVYVATADPLLLERRARFFERHPYHVGANWFNLHRSLLEHMRTDPFTYTLYDVLRSTFIPDESFFQTYLMNSPFVERRDHRYDRLILRPGPTPRVKVFDRTDWPVIAGCTELFGRKFDTRHDGRLVDTVLASRSA